MTMILSATPETLELRNGERLSRDEFMRRWEALPGVKFAELLHGVVFVPSPLSTEHADVDSNLHGWLAFYQVATPGCQACLNSTWYMGTDHAPQPDQTLRILPTHGGQSRPAGPYLAGGPELAVEVSLSSARSDLHEKLDIYEANGVQEYLVVLLGEQRVQWHTRVGDVLVARSAPTDGIHRSAVFPGLWLDEAALFAGDLARMFAVLQQGLATPEHAAFVAQLAEARHQRTGEGGAS